MYKAGDSVVLLLGNDSAYMKRESSKRSCVSQIWAPDFQDAAAIQFMIKSLQMQASPNALATPRP